MAERRHRFLVGLVTALAVVLLLAALLVPDNPDQLSVATLARVPVEAAVLLLAAILVPTRARGWVLGGLGVVIALVAVVKMLDLGFLLTFYRPFDPLTDPSYATAGWGVLVNAVGRLRAVLVVAGAALLVVGLLVGIPAAAIRVAGVAARHRAAAVVVLAALVVGWVVAGSATTSTSAVAHVAAVRDGLRDRAEFAQEAAQDPYAAVPPEQLLGGLRGKDVLLVFVESYGRVALADPAISPQVNAALGRMSAQLGAAGFGARSAYLTSPTFAGLSWLAHSTMQSGLRINDQVRYNALLSGNRLTLATGFGRAGWRTVLDSPANENDFAPEMAFYGYQAGYDSLNVGYTGPAFGYAPVPDQYTLAALMARELSAPGRAPVFAEVDLISSHAPWAPLPRMVDPTALGDGSVYGPMWAEAPTADEVWRDTDRVRQAYAQSVAYSLDALTSFVERAHNDNLVLVVLGDHQPAGVISGPDASHDVPVSVVAHDPTVLDRIAGWQWQPGWAPTPNAPVWPMEAFRDRFFAAYAS